MRHIGTLPDETQARTFVDYVLVRGVKGTVERDDGGWSVWAFDEDSVETAREEFAAFREQPDDPKYTEAARQAATLRKVAERQKAKIEKRVVNVREEWDRPLPQRIPLTFALAAACIGVTIASDFGKQAEPVLTWVSFAREFDAGEGMPVLKPGAGTFDEIRRGEIWRLVTPVFIHYSFLHIAFNVYWTMILGGMIELRRGKWRLLGLVLFTAVLSNVAQAAWQGPYFGGFSGVNYGLFGYVWMRSRFDPESGLYISPNNVVFFMLWFFLCFTPAVGPIANLAHTGGLVTGLMIGYAPKLWRDLSR